MNYHNITHDDMLNGDGLRVVLWVAGCTHHCFECQNPITWDVNNGLPFDEDAKNELFNKLKKDYISGITFSGGDPLHPSNRETIKELAKYIKSDPDFNGKTIWLYTGYDYQYVKTNFYDILQYIDVLVDGEFKIDLKDNKLHWKGSSNQKVINVQESLKQGKVVLWEE